MQKIIIIPENPVDPTRTPNSESRIPVDPTRTPNSESRTPNPEPRTPNPEPRTPNPNPRTPNPESLLILPEPRTPNPELRTPPSFTQQVKKTYFSRRYHFLGLHPLPGCGWREDASRSGKWQLLGKETIKVLNLLPLHEKFSKRVVTWRSALGSLRPF